MEFFRDSNFEFMKYRKYFVILSIGLLVFSLISVFAIGQLNLGIDFSGGTQVTVKFKEKPEIDDLRRIMAEAGIEDAQIQSFGAESENEALIRTSTAPGQEEGTQDLVLSALNAEYNRESPELFDLNQRGTEALADHLLGLDPDKVRVQDEVMARNHYDAVAEAVLDLRRNDGLLISYEQLEQLEATTAETMAALRQNTRMGALAVLGVESVGPQIGSELRHKGIMAIVASLIGMLIYIWMRFELRFGVGALVALTHDVFIVLGLFALAGFEFNLTTIAGFLTLVGYSVNDTVVVFDRVRENLRRSRREPLESVMNRSLNQTLSRTALTSSTTLLVVGSLFLFGGDVLRGFAFILTVGVVVGTYSSIYVASPFALLWERLFGKRAF